MTNNKKMFVNKNKAKISNSIDKYKNKIFGLNDNLKKNLNSIHFHKHKEKGQEDSSRSPSPKQNKKNKKEKQKEKEKKKEKQKEENNKNKASTSNTAASTSNSATTSTSTTPESSVCNSPVSMDIDDMDNEKASISSNENTVTGSDEKLNNENDKLKKSSSISSFEKNMPNIRKGNIKDMDIDFKSLIRRGSSYQSDSSSTLYGNSKFNKKRHDTFEVVNSQEKNKKMMETINIINNLVNDYIELINKKNKDSNKEVTEIQQLELLNLEDFHNSTNHLVTLLDEDRFPLIALIGRRGSGKSSFVNAILGKKVAELGNIRSQTGEANLLSYRGNNNSGMDILDTRGINEGQKPQEDDKYETPVGK